MPKHCIKSDIKIKTVICPICGRKFKRKSTSGKRYCSDKCRETAQSNNRISNEIWQARVMAIRQETNKLSPEVANEGYKYIRAAVLQQAVDDYANALVNFHGGAVKSLEKWFLSEWGQAFSENNGEKIIERVRKECGKEKRV